MLRETLPLGFALRRKPHNGDNSQRRARKKLDLGRMRRPTKRVIIMMPAMVLSRMQRVPCRSNCAAHDVQLCMRWFMRSFLCMFSSPNLRCIHGITRMCVCVRVRILMCMCAYACLCCLCANIYVRVHMYVCACACMYLNTCVCADANICK